MVKRMSRKMFGEVPEPVGVAWHNRKVLNLSFSLGRKLQKWDQCDENLKSFAHMATASLVGCSFCLDFGYFHAHNEGLDVTKAREVPRWRESDVFTPLERDVMEYAEAMTQTPPTVTDELSARLLKALGPAALVELTTVIALANLMARSNVAMGIESQEFSAACDLKPLALASYGMTDDPFVTHRGLLFTVAYEMLGSAVDAEDVVQETWLRWADVDQAEVRDPRAYLVRIVTRQALNRLRTVSRRREDYVGEWLPEPLLTSPDVAEDAELAENVSIAMLTVLETLGPAERAVFVLHEVFETPYDEIAEVVGKTPAAVRQIAHRAREHVAARRPRMQVDRAQQEATLEKFMAAITSGDVQGLVEVLAPDVVLIADGGGLVAAARKPLTGAETVVAFLARVADLSGLGGDHRLAQRHARCPVRRRWRSHRGESGDRGRPDHSDLRHPQPAQAGMAGTGGGTAAVTVLRSIIAIRRGSPSRGRLASWS